MSANISNNNCYDVVIIGSGPGGYVAAIRSSQLGLKVCIIEKEDLGGICLNWGCIPTKALLKSAEIKNILDNADKYGFTLSGYEINFDKIVERSRSVSEQLSAGVKHLMKKNNITVYKGHGKINKDKKNKKIVEVFESSNGKAFQLETNNIILATGAKAKELPFISTNQEYVWDYKTAMIPNSLPKSIVIVGSGAIGMEFASFYNDLGTKVSIVETEENVLPNEDHEISEFVSKSFISRGIEILTNTKLTNIKKGLLINCITNSNGEEKIIEAEKVIVAVGIVANIENLGLDNFNIKLVNGHIKTSNYMETSEEGIFAIGDLTDGPWLAHKASHEGIICAERIKGIEHGCINKLEIPSCTYCRPQIASLGLTEKNALKNGYEIRIGKFPFVGNGKAKAVNEEDGFIKTIFNKSNGELLGVHMIGPEVTELIHGFAIAKKLETTEEELISTIFPHPTLSEAMHESVMDAFGKVIHF